MGRPFKCPYCESTQTAWKGYRKTVKGRARLRRCKRCGRKFTTNQIILDNIGGAQ